MSDGTVLVAYVHPGTEVQHSFATCLMALANYDAAHHQRLFAAGGPLQMRAGTGALVQARNSVMRTWLDEHDDEWLWMVDSDMGFAADVVDRLVEAADPQERPVVGGLCFALKQGAPDGMGGFETHPYPTIFDWTEGPNGQVGFWARRDYPRDTLMQVAGTGAACLLVHRSAAEKVRAECGDAWFEPVRYQDGSGRIVSEDLSFCYRLNKVGSGVFVHTGVRTSHAKQVWLSERDYLRYVALEDAIAAAESSGG